MAKGNSSFADVIRRTADGRDINELFAEMQSSPHGRRRSWALRTRVFLGEMTQVHAASAHPARHSDSSIPAAWAIAASSCQTRASWWRGCSVGSAYGPMSRGYGLLSQRVLVGRRSPSALLRNLA
jgi:hypothetical protein